MVELTSNPRLCVLLSVCILATMSGCVEKRLPVRLDDQPGPYQSILLDVRGETSHFERFGDIRPPAGRVTLDVETVSGDLTTLELSIGQSLECQRQDEIPTERVTVIERSPAKELLAPTLLGIVGTAAGLGWSAYGLTMYQRLPPPSPAASDNERRQDQLLQVTLPLTTLGISLALVAIPAFASIDGAERAPGPPRFGGPERWESCAAPETTTVANIRSGFFRQAVSSQALEIKGDKIDLSGVNLMGAVERLTTIGQACVEHCTVQAKAFRPLTVAEKKARIQKTRAALVTFLEETKAYLQGDRARSSVAYQKALNETTRVMLRVGNSEGVNLKMLAERLIEAGESTRAEDARTVGAAYFASLPKAASRTRAKKPRYVPVLAADRLVAAPWTCLETAGKNPFEVTFQLATPPAGVALNKNGELCFDWSRYAPSAPRIIQLRTQVASALLKDALRNVKTIRRALRGEMPLQKDIMKAQGSAPKEQVARALILAAREYGYYHKGSTRLDDLDMLLKEVSRRQAQEDGSEAAMAAFLKVFPETPATPAQAPAGDTP